MKFFTTMALKDLTPGFVKTNYLTGLQLLDANGEDMPDSFYEHHLRVAVAKLEDFTSVDILEHVWISERHDYSVSDYIEFCFIPLFHIPGRSVEAVRAVYPTGQTLQEFPADWIKIEKSRSQIQMVPTSGALSQVLIGQGADYVPVIFGGISHLPHLWEIDYTSGFDPEAVPLMIIDAIAKLACAEMLQIMADTVMPIGLQSSSLSVDGLSQSKSYQTPAFMARITAYKNDLGLPGSPNYGPGLIAQIRSTYHGIPIVSM